MARTMKNTDIGRSGTKPQKTAEIELESAAKEAFMNLLSIMRSDTVSVPTRLNAARTVLEAAGVIGAGRQVRRDKAPESMSAFELQTALAAIEGELAGRAKPLNAPNERANPSQVIEGLDD